MDLSGISFHGRIGAAAESKRSDVNLHLLTLAIFLTAGRTQIFFLLTQCKSTLHNTQNSLMGKAVESELVRNMADPFMYIKGRVGI
jgi:hypothetical protein